LDLGEEPPIINFFEYPWGFTPPPAKHQNLPPALMDFDFMSLSWFTLFGYADWVSREKRPGDAAGLGSPRRYINIYI